MATHLLTRWVASITLALLMLIVVAMAFGQSSKVQAGYLASRVRLPLLSTDYTVGGSCGSTIQACIKNPIVYPGDRILIPAGTYHESVTLNKAVSLIGADADTAIIQAISNQRVLTVTGVTISNSVVISGLTFTGGNLGFTSGNCPADCGAGILLINKAQPLIYNSIITGNAAIVSGGGIYADANIALTLTNVRLVSNTNGLDALGPVVMIGGVVADNGIGLRAENTLYLSGTEILNNYSYGGVYATGAVTITRGRFEGNSTNNSQGGGGLLTLGNLTAQDTVFIGNRAFGQGGGGARVIGTATFIRGQFVNNRAPSTYGGGLYAVSVLIINGTRFFSNTAEFDGGGLRVDGSATIVNGLFENNVGGRVFGSGGGLSAYDTLTITATKFISNSTVGNGGAIYHGNLIGLGRPVGNGRIVNTVFARNKSGSNGAGLYLKSGGNETIIYATFADVSLYSNNAIAVVTGTVGITDTIIASYTTGIDQSGGTVYEDYNLFFGNTFTQTGSIIDGGHSITGDPSFANPAIDDYHIISPSAAINTGVNVGVYIDLDGNIRPFGSGFDIGAYEYVHFNYHIDLPLVLKNQ